MNKNVFEKISNMWWNKNGPCQPLHVLNSIRFNYIANTSNIKNKTILDLGCGGGILSEKLALHGAIVTGIDTSTSLINIAKRRSHAEKLNINYQNCDINDFYKKNKAKFDIIICMEMLEHINEKNTLLNTCKLISNDNGLIFISSLNKDIKTYAYIILSGEYLSQKIEKKTHLYETFISIYELKTELTKLNFKIENIKGLKYNAISNYAKISNNSIQNYIIKIKNEN